MELYYRRISEAADYLASRLTTQPEIGIVLGSGLGSLADEIRDARHIDYADIPGFPVTTVEGHEGRLLSGSLGGKNVLVMKGRFHYYEGYDVMDVVFPIRVFRKLGIGALIVTNAAGGVNRGFSPGDLMVIRDHISLFAPSPLRGRNLEELGSRFPDMSEAYTKSLIELAQKAALEEGTELREGIYAFAQGPMYETPAEIRVLSLLGADAVGMSTVPEVIAARHAGMKILGISCITNMAAGILERPLYHGEVVETASKAERRFKELLKKILEMWKD